MGKTLSTVLKVGAVVAGIALAIPSGGTSLLATTLGVSSIAATAIVTGLALGSSLLAPKPKVPSPSPEDRNRLLATIDARTPRKIWFGDTAAPTDIQDQEFTGAQEYLHRFIVCSSHKASQFREVWFDDKLAWTAAGGAQGEYAGYLTITPILEGSAANAINISARMGSNRRYTGCAYLHVRYKLTGNDKKATSPFAQAIPSRVTIRGKGAPLYDPRLDTTAGGSGAQRAADQTTWAWSDDAGRNPALQLLWYLLGWRIQNPVTSAWKLAVGKGIPAARIDLDSFITAANLCDEPVARAAGGTEPRYRSDGVFSEGDDPSLVLDNLKAAMNAVLDDVDGKIRITVLHNDLGTPRAALTTNDVLGEFKWAQSPPLPSTFNVIRGSYTDPSDASLYQSIDYPEVRIASPDGIDRIETINLPLVQSASQAQRLVKQRLQRQLYPGTFDAVFQATAWRYLKGDVVPFTFAPLGWTNKLFRIVAIEVRVDGTVPMTLREENAAIYAWDASDAAPVVGAAPTTYDYTLDPFYQDLVAVVDTAAAALGAAEAASTLADGKSTLFYQATPPTVAESSENDRWIDTDAGNFEYRRIAGNGRLSIGGTVVTFGGSAIIYPPWAPADDQRIGQALVDAAGAKATADSKVLTFNQEAQPAAEGIGDLWYQPSTKSLKRWDGDSWEEVATVGATPAQIALIEGALTAAENAQATADGKITSFYQASAPTLFSEGDYWTDTDDANKLYRASADSTASGTWVAIRDSGIASAIAAAAGAQSTADGKVTSFVGTSAPTAEGVGDLWYNPDTGVMKRWDGDSWESTADATALNQAVPSLSAPSIDVPADYTGAIGAGTLPKTLQVTVRRGGTDVTTADAVSYNLTGFTGGCTSTNVTVNNTNGSSSKGQISVGTGWTTNGSFTLFVSYAGTIVGSWVIPVTKQLGAPPSGGGSGSSGYVKTGNFSAAGKAITSTSYVEIGRIPNMQKAAGETIYATFNGSYDVSGGTGANGAYAKWQYSPAGANTWTDFSGGAATGTNATNIYNGGGGGHNLPSPDDPPEWDTSPGSVTCNRTAVPADGNYDLRLVAARISATPALVFGDGTAAVEIKP